MHREEAKACLEEIVKDDRLLDMLANALAKRAAGISAKPPVKATTAPVPPAPAKPFKASTPKADAAFDSE